MEIPKEKLKWIKEISDLNKIPEVKLINFYKKTINDPKNRLAYPKDEDLLDFADIDLSVNLEKIQKEYSTIGFRIYLFKGGEIGADVKGTLVSLGTGNKEIGRKMFNHWDEIPSGMRKLIKKEGYKKKLKDDHWEFEKK